ncbi:hypothetical protein ISCGN_015965 [Ixodes scapularis]
MTTDLLKMARRKRTLFKKAARMHCPVLLQEAKQLQRLLKTAIYVAFNNYSRIIAGKIKDDPQWFWAFVSRQRSTPHKPCLLSGDRRVTAPRDIAQLFATQFSSVYGSHSGDRDVDTLVDEVEASTICPTTVLSTIQFSPEDLQSAIERLKSSRSVGPDHLAPTFLKLDDDVISDVTDHVISDDDDPDAHDVICDVTDDVISNDADDVTDDVISDVTRPIMHRAVTPTATATATPLKLRSQTCRFKFVFMSTIALCTMMLFLYIIST